MSGKVVTGVLVKVKESSHYVDFIIRADTYSYNSRTNKTTFLDTTKYGPPSHYKQASGGCLAKW